jgi:hypothetical protein
VRAVIGDQLRIPITWCEMGSCISWHADPAALGEADNRARAIRAGWRIDALGRMTCPRCLQTAADFRASRPLVLWDRYTAITMAARKQPRPRRPASGHPPASPPGPGQHRVHPAASTVAAGRQTRRTPASTTIPAAWCRSRTESGEPTVRPDGARQTGEHR